MELTEREEQNNEALKILEEWNKNNYFEVHDKKFTFSGFTIPEKTNIISYYSTIEHLILLGTHSYLAEAKYKEIKKLIETKTLFEDVQISKIVDFWDNNEEYLLEFFDIACKTICFKMLKKKFILN